MSKNNDYEKIENRNTKEVSNQVKRLRALFSTSALLHPYLPAGHFLETESMSTNNSTAICDGDSADMPNNGNSGQTKDKVIINFTDLSAVIAEFCGVEETHQSNHDDATICEEEEERNRRNYLKHKIFNNNKPPRHMIVLLCDGLGSSILDNSTSSALFLQKCNCDDVSLRSVFPSTTPAALSTFATAVWPMQHGIVGWDLKQNNKKCTFPGMPPQTQDNIDDVQIRILDKYFTDASSGKSLLNDLGYAINDIFMDKPWIEKINNVTKQNNNYNREMFYINAYNGDEFQNWCQSKEQDKTMSQPIKASEFSLWQRGRGDGSINNTKNKISKTITIGETDSASIGTNEGTLKTIDYLQHGLLNATKEILLSKEKNNDDENKSTFTYVYTAHPDKHMHKLGTSHVEIKNLIQGFNNTIETFWNDVIISNNINDVTMIITADHGHITVSKEDTILLPDDVLECLSYANIGIHGKVIIFLICSHIYFLTLIKNTHPISSIIMVTKGRHALLHCHSGLQAIFYNRWNQSSVLHQNFILLSINEATQEGLFGPCNHNNMPLRVLQRLGDFVAISINNCTLVTPMEFEKYSNVDEGQGAHGSLLPQEVNIPFILCQS